MSCAIRPHIPVLSRLSRLKVMPKVLPAMVLTSSPASRRLPSSTGSASLLSGKAVAACGEAACTAACADLADDLFISG